MKFPEDNKEFEAAWSYAAGELNGLTQSITELDACAGRLYVARHDDAADRMRSVSETLSRRASKLNMDLREFKEEADRRSYELRTKQPGHPGVHAPYTVT